MRSCRPRLLVLHRTHCTAPHGTAAPSGPAQEPASLQAQQDHDICRRRRPHHASRSPSAPQIARARRTWDRLACGVARVGVQRQGYGSWTGKRAHDAHNAHAKAVMVVLVLGAGGGSSGQRVESLRARRARCLPARPAAFDRHGGIGGFRSGRTPGRIRTGEEGGGW